ncbi:MAG TPA: OmpH family outer membrane protein [Bacteroidaceae bacterium]|nr:OmpH family outer membrane protein [Bacteroidaceae bacterium]
MKIRKGHNGLLLSVLVVLFTQCTNKPTSSTSIAVVPYNPDSVSVETTNIKIAYVDIDSLLVNYNFYLDLSEEMLRKEENSRLHLTEEASKFQKEYEDFQKKIQNNVFSSQERAQQEQDRLVRRQQELQDLNERLSRELSIEHENNSLRISEAIQTFLKEYNKENGFNIILSKVGDNILLIDPSMNITNEVLNGLNKSYRSKK